jgi:diguanylate cyclase (GGDEF)-like protein
MSATAPSNRMIRVNELLKREIGEVIEKNISLFVADRKLQYSDPLTKSEAVIEDLADIYKFKKTIEHDKNKDVIYARLVKFFKESLSINDISLYEVSTITDTRKLIYDDTPEKFCDIADKNTSEHCRAYRTDSVILSDEFPNLCQACNTTKEYLCINHPINDTISLILNIKPKNKEELHENKKAIGYIRNYLESAKPVLQSKILTEILQESNLKDGLTGLFNRKYLDEYMDGLTNKQTQFGIIMLDIDFFKMVNDTYGHDNGDEAIKMLSELFRELINPNDIAFRFGGEEFVIYVDDSAATEELANEIRIAFSNIVFDFNGDSVKKTLSAGVSLYPDDGKSAWKLIKYADLALYEAKESGRNRVVKYYSKLSEPKG